MDEPSLALAKQIESSLEISVEESDLKELYNNGDFSDFNFSTRCLVFQLDVTYEKFVNQMDTVRSILPDSFSVYCNPIYYKGSISEEIDDISYLKMARVGNPPNHSLDIQESLLEKFEQWKSQFGAVLYGALGATMILKFDINEENARLIAAEVMDICPKYCNGTVDDAAKVLKFDNGFCILHWIIVY